MPIYKFEDLNAWQEARALTRQVYALTRVGGFARDFNLVDQSRSACVSIMNNIAEGFGRGTTRDYIRFLTYANGSAHEVQSCLHVAVDQQYIEQRIFDECYARAFASSRLVGGLIHSLRRRLR